jgi:hypothetical protein
VVVAARNVTVNSSLLNSRSKARLYEPSGKFMVAASALHKHRRMGALKSFSALERLASPYPNRIIQTALAMSAMLTPIFGNTVRMQPPLPAVATTSVCLVGSCLQQEDPQPARWAIHLSKRCREFRQLPADQSRRAGATTAHVPAAGLVSRSTRNKACNLGRPPTHRNASVVSPRRTALQREALLAFVLSQPGLLRALRRLARST